MWVREPGGTPHGEGAFGKDASCKKGAWGINTQTSLLPPSASCSGLPLAKQTQQESRGQPWDQSRVARSLNESEGHLEGPIQSESAPKTHPATWPGLLSWVIHQRLTRDPGSEGTLGSFRPVGELCGVLERALLTSV